MELSQFPGMQPLFRQLSLNYGFGEVVSVNSGGGLANENFVVQFTNGKFFIKCLNNHTEEDINSQVSMVDRVVSRGFPTVRFLRQLDGSAYFKSERGLITVQPWVFGENVDVMNSDMLNQVGQILSTLHLIPVDDIAARSTWWDKEFIDKRFNSLVETTDSDIKISVNKVRNRISGLQPIPRDECPMSLVHGDPWSGNILWLEGKLKWVLDWDEVTIGPSIYDLVYAALTSCYKDAGFDHVAFNSLNTAYQKGRPFEEVEKRHLIEIADRLVCTNSVWLLEKCHQSNSPREMLEIIDWLLGLDIDLLSV